MSTEDPREPNAVPRRVATTPVTVLPLRRTLGFWSLPEAERANASLVHALTHYIEPISDEEAAAFGVPVQPTVGEQIQQGIREANRFYAERTSAEIAPAEDDSFTTERFGAEDGSEQNGTPLHPQFTPRHPAARPRPRTR
jgi:hypothetical protein